MSGWLLAVAIGAAALVAWLIWLLYRAGRRERARRPRPAERGPVPDTEFSAEVFVPPEVASLGPEAGAEAPPEARGGEPAPEAEAGPAPGPLERPVRPRPGPWGKVAVPSWEHPLPWSYDETRLVLLVRDPYWLFAYWELTRAVHRAAEEKVGAEIWARSRPVLRVYDVTDPIYGGATGSFYDVAVDEAARNWYLNVGQPDRTWYVEIGRITPGGEFVMLARSNKVHTPRDMPSDIIDERWPPLQVEPFWPGERPASPGVKLAPAFQAEGRRTR